MQIKVCIACKVEKPITGFPYSPNSSAPDKIGIICTECSATLPEREKVRLQTAHWRKSNPERARTNQANQHLTKTYKISLKEYQEMEKQQEGVCAICGQPSNVRHQSGKIRALVVDHDHQTSKVRGLLCGPCNLGIGYFGEKIERLELAIAYLKRHKE